MAVRYPNGMTKEEFEAKIRKDPEGFRRMYLQADIFIFIEGND